MPGYLVVDIDADTVRGSLGEKRSKEIILPRLCQSLDGTAGTGLLKDSSVPQKGYKYFVSPAIKQNQEEKMLYDAQELKARLEVMLKDDQEKLAAKQIREYAEELFRDDNFVYQREAVLLSSIEIEKLKQFIDKIVEIRDNLEIEYKEAITKLKVE